MKFTLLLLFILHLSFAVQAQDMLLEGTVNTKGIIYSGDESPFWIHSNQRGRVDERSNVAGWINGLATYDISESASFKMGLGLLYSDGYLDKLQLDESYLSFENDWLLVSVGRRQREEMYNGLSASNENILWSLNARPVPGIGFEIIRPIYFSQKAGLGFKLSLEEYITDDDRYVKDTRIHHKSFHLVFDGVYNWEFIVGLEHFVQWGGISPVFGELPGGFQDYRNVFTGMEGEDDVRGEEANAIGNHLGGYVAGIKTSFDNYQIEVIYNHLFEDGSGRVLVNTPDGRYGIFIADKEPGKWIDAMMYEFYYTKNQSKNSPTTDGIDNYFNNNVYRSGWTYESRILGVPFINLDEERFRIGNNKFIAHHVGISGLAWGNLPYTLLTSYRKNYGSKTNSNQPNEILSSYLDLRIYKSDLNVNLQLGSDFNSIASPNFGLGIQLTKELY